MKLNNYTPGIDKKIYSITSLISSKLGLCLKMDCFSTMLAIKIYMLQLWYLPQHQSVPSPLCLWFSDQVIPFVGAETFRNLPADSSMILCSIKGGSHGVLQEKQNAILLSYLINGWFTAQNNQTNVSNIEKIKLLVLCSVFEEKWKPQTPALYRQ